MVLLMALLLLPWDQPTPGVSIEGKASFYNIRRMQEVAYNRGMELDGAIDFVSMNRKGDLGRLVWIEKDGVVYGPYRNIDCSQEGEHYLAREDKKLVIEVSWEQAQAWKMIRPIPVRVWLVPPDKVTKYEAI